LLDGAFGAPSNTSQNLNVSSPAPVTIFVLQGDNPS